jgi:hypothetical protein
MSVVPVGVETAEDLAVVATSGLVLVCNGCGEAEAALECECCGEHLCHECWGDGDPYCQACMVEEADGRSVVNVDVGGEYL